MLWRDRRGRWAAHHTTLRINFGSRRPSPAEVPSQFKVGWHCSARKVPQSGWLNPRAFVLLRGCFCCCHSTPPCVAHEAALLPPGISIDPASMRARAASAGCVSGVLSGGLAPLPPGVAAPPGAAGGFLDPPNASRAAATPGRGQLCPPPRLFVGNLAYTVDEAMVRRAFEAKHFGPVLDVRVVRDRQTKVSKGFGFVTLSAPELANAAIDRSADGLLKIDGRLARIGMAEQAGSGGGARPRLPAQDTVGWEVGGDAATAASESAPPPPAGCAVSYICRLPTSRGKFNPEKALSLGVTKGKNFGLLASGKSVTTAEGRVVDPHEVVGATVVGTCLLVLSCPNSACWKELKAAQPIQRLMAEVRESGSGVEPPQLVVAHFTSAELLSSEAYKSWISDHGSFGPTGVRHVLIPTCGADLPGAAAAGGGGGSSSPHPRAGLGLTRALPSFSASGALCAKLHAIQPKVFPWLGQVAVTSLPSLEPALS